MIHLMSILILCLAMNNSMQYLNSQLESVWSNSYIIVCTEARIDYERYPKIAFISFIVGKLSKYILCLLWSIKSVDVDIKLILFSLIIISLN